MSKMRPWENRRFSGMIGTSVVWDRPDSSEYVTIKPSKRAVTMTSEEASKYLKELSVSWTGEDFVTIHPSREPLNIEVLNIKRNLDDASLEISSSPNIWPDPNKPIKPITARMTTSVPNIWDAPKEDLIAVDIETNHTPDILIIDDPVPRVDLVTKALRDNMEKLMVKNFFG